MQASTWFLMHAGVVVKHRDNLCSQIFTLTTEALYVRVKAWRQNYARKQSPRKNLKSKTKDIGLAPGLGPARSETSPFVPPNATPV